MRHGARVTELLRDGDRVVGVRSRARTASAARRRPGGGLRRRRLAGARHGGPRGRGVGPLRRDPHLHEPVGDRPLVLDALPLRRRPDGAARLARGVGRLAHDRPGRARGGARPGRGGVPRVVRAPDARGRRRARGRHLHRPAPLPGARRAAGRALVGAGRGADRRRRPLLRPRDRCRRGARAGRRAGPGHRRRRRAGRRGRGLRALRGLARSGHPAVRGGRPAAGRMALPNADRPPAERWPPA